jgi:hypothetical protein
MHHQPGWRLPRRTALARRYNVSTEQLDVALEELADRHLIRLLPDGQLYRASPVDYLIQLKGVHGFASCIDPMGAVISCQSFHVSWRRVPEEIGQALGVDSSSVCVARLVWTADETPAAVTTTYLTSIPPGLAIGEQPTGPVAALTALPLPLVLAQPNETDAAEVAGAFRMQALSVEMRPPPPQIARSLHLSAAEAATLITALFENSGNGAPAALTVAVLRPDMFRVTIEWPGSRDRPQSWVQAVDDAKL